MNSTIFIFLKIILLIFYLLYKVFEGIFLVLSLGIFCSLYFLKISKKRNKFFWRKRLFFSKIWTLYKGYINAKTKPSLNETWEDVKVTKHEGIFKVIFKLINFTWVNYHYSPFKYAQHELFFKKEKILWRSPVTKNIISNTYILHIF